MKEKPIEPKLFEYLDAIAYLQDYYKWRKAADKNFSYEFWNDELQFKSRSYIRMMIMGKKKISSKFVETFNRLNFSQKEEQDYFFYLVKYSQAINQNEKKAFSAKLIQSLKTESKQSIIEPHTDFISNPALPRLYTLLGFKDITPTLGNLAKMMMLPADQIEVFLQKLEELGLAMQIRVDEQIHWTALHESFKVPDDKGSLNLMKFHAHSLQEAIQAFEQPKHLRRYKSLILPLSENELSELHASVDAFVTEKVARYSPSQYQTRRLFQLNLNIHAVAQSAELVNSN